VAVRPGIRVVLKVEDAVLGGSWLRIDKDDHIVALPDDAKATDDTLSFVMDQTGTCSGVYAFGTNQNRSNHLNVTRSKSLVGRLLQGAVPFVLAAVAYAAIVIWAVANRKTGATTASITVRAYLFAAATLAFGIFLVYLAAKGGTGLAGLVQGDDHRVSTSKVQYLLWTVGVAFALAYIGGRVLADSTERFTCDAGRTRNCVPVENWDQYIILLGVPAAAAVIAKGIVSFKVTNGLVQKTAAEQGSLADVTTNDDGKADLVDTQYLLFNVIAFVFVAVSFIRTGTLVSVPNLLLGLTSAGAATYVLNKSLQANKPIITGVSPSLISPGEGLTIEGKNLFPPGSSDVVTVKVGGVPTSGKRSPISTTGIKSTDDSVIARAPDGMSEEDKTVTVITDSHIETEPYPITITGSLSVIGFIDSAPGPGQTAKIRVEGLPSTTSQVWVTFGATTRSGKHADGIVTTEVPGSLAGNSEIAISVGASGRWSSPKTLKLGPTP
jgi:hypothetical protein